MEKEQLLPSSGMPPPYEQSEAYPKRRRSPRLFVRSMVSVRLILTFIITVSIIWLCAAVHSQKRSHSLPNTYTASRDAIHFHEALSQCESLKTFPVRVEATSRTSNSRWSPQNGQNRTVVLRNAKLFDGQTFTPSLVDIVFSEGLIKSVSDSSVNVASLAGADEFDVHGRYVTPGLVDMHSHHLAGVWPKTESTEDDNEMNDATKAFTPMVRIIDSMKAYDEGTRIVMSGGITTSLILPGSANLMGGEATPVKNVLYSGEDHEPVVEELLLERGIPQESRHRYMKMAFGENPKGLWGYSRMGNAWHLREHMQKAKDLMEKQDDYCTALHHAHKSGDDWMAARFVEDQGKFPFDIALESTVGVLRGRVLVQNHNYEPQDIETMLRIGREFGFKVWGFHHALEAWQVPEMLKDLAENVTIATFAEFSLYKWEAFSPSLYAGHILDKHGVSIAYKSDHTMSFTNAKYLASQAAVGHSFLLPENKALQSITSIPAKAIDMDNRVGYCRPGYDADIVVWDSHPLSTGATPLQVFIDGQAQLDQKKVKESTGTTFVSPVAEQEAIFPTTEVQMRFEPETQTRQQVCSDAAQDSPSFIITGIQKAFVDNHPQLASALGDDDTDGELLLVMSKGQVVCLGSSSRCAQSKADVHAIGNSIEINLQNGHVLPGLTAVTGSLGMRDIADLEDTGDGESSKQKIDDPDSVSYAKYGVWLDGKQFARARLGGVTRAISPPIADQSGMVHGVSVEILTSGKKTVSNGGIVQGDVALHVVLGDGTKMSEDTVSNGVKAIRKMLKDGKGKNNETVYGQVASGELPLVIFCNNKYDLGQVILIKKDFPETNIVIEGGNEASFVAKELAEANIPVILTEDHGAPDSYRKKDAVIGPPLSRSIASHLVEAGVEFALALNNYPMRAEWRIHDLAPEAGWTAKYAGLGEKATVDLVTKNVEKILGLKPSKDLVIYEGSPLRFGATVVLAFHADEETGDLEVATCYPREDEFQ